MTLIGRLLNHPTLVPLTFLGCLVAGVVVLFGLNKQLWPDYEVSYGSVTITWPDAPIEAVDRQISGRVHDLLNGLNSIANVTTTSDEGASNSFFEIVLGENQSSVMREVEQAVRGLWGLPQDARPPLVRLIEPTDSIARLKVSGPFDATAAQALAAEVTKVLAQHGVTRVTQIAPPLPAQIITIDQSAMLAFGLTQKELEAKLRDFYAAPETFALQSDTSSSTIEMQRSRDSGFVGDLIIQNSPTPIRLSDVATFTRADDVTAAQPVFREGEGVFFQISRGKDEDLIMLSRAVRNAVEELAATYPAGMRFELFDIQADRLEQRIVLLAENAIEGVVLVFLVLLVGIGLRVALWVSVGLTTTFAMSFLIMGLTGQSINYVSVFAMIMVIGILVDDAIVVAERIDYEVALARDGAVERAIGITWRPVLVSTLTTIAGFAPILMLQDSIGSYVAAIPLFVCSALAASYVECFGFMPHHMKPRQTGGASRPLQFGIGGLIRVGSGMLLSIVGWASRTRRAAAAAIFGGSFVASLLLLVFSPAPFTFWLNPETRVAMAYLTLPDGTTLGETRQELEHVWQALETLQDEPNYADIVNVTFGIFGQHFLRPYHPFDPARSTVFVELSSEAAQGASTAEFVRRWKEEVANLPSRKAVVSIGEQQVGLEGADIEVVLSHPNLDLLSEAALQLEDALLNDPSLGDVTNSLFGAREGLLIRPNPFAHSIQGVSQENIQAAVLSSLRQVSGENNWGGRAGNWILRMGDPDDPLGTLLETQVDSSSGALAGDTVTLDRRSAALPLTRRDGELTATITAELIDAEGSAAPLRDRLEAKTFPALSASYGTEQRFAGAIEVQDDTLRSVAIAAALAMVLMFVTLAISFGDYLRPLVVLVSLPVGAAAGVLGHALMGYPVTLLSLVAFLGLSGILVNDLVLLIEAFDRRYRRGIAAAQSLMEAFSERLRAIVLTSATTTLGLLPLMLDGSSEARFLIPIAISIVFGLTAAMIVNLVLFPCSIVALLGHNSISAKLRM